MANLGTLGWARRTGGIITEEDERELDGRLNAIFEAAARPASELPPLVTFEGLAPPDTELCIEATALWNLVAPDWLAHHGYRTWYFARALAEIDNLKPDDELLYVAALLHDLGLTKHVVPTDEEPCFAVRGGHEAGLLTEPHRGAEAAAIVNEAIVMHLNLAVPLDDGVINYLVAAGTLIDVSGPRLQLLPNDLLAAILVEHPRGVFADKISEVFMKVGDRYADTRCGYLENHLSLSKLVKQHPLDLGVS